MARWIAFDQQTSSLLRTSLAQGTTIETYGSGAVAYALAKPGAVVTLVPATDSSGVGIAVFRPQGIRRSGRQASPATTNNLPESVSFAKTLSANPFAAKASSANTRAGGFLGLSDEPVFEDEPVQEKKGWWRRFWDNE